MLGNPSRRRRTRPSHPVRHCPALRMVVGASLTAAVAVSSHLIAAQDTGLMSPQVIAAHAITFAPQQDYGVGAGPRNVITADLDGNEIADLVVANFNASTISVLMGNGDGTFRTLPALAAGDGVHSLAAGDVNEDGNMDLAATNASADSVSVFLGNGDGTFASRWDTHTGPESCYGTRTNTCEPAGVVLADLNHDSHLDMAVADQSAKMVSIFVGLGNGTFTHERDLLVGPGEVPSLVSRDFDRDGSADLAVVSHMADALYVYKSDGAFTPTDTETIPGGPVSIAAGDFNGDGQMDLAAACARANLVTLLFGGGDGTFAIGGSYEVGSTPYQLVTADFDGDGRLDLATSNTSGNTMTVLRNDGTGAFERAADVGSFSFNHSLAVADFNRDGRPDLAVASFGSNRLSILLNTTPFPPLLTGVSPGTVVPGDRVTLVGARFSTSGVVTLGALDMPIVTWSDGAITAIVPPVAIRDAAYGVAVTTTTGTSDQQYLYVRGAGGAGRNTTPAPGQTGEHPAPGPSAARLTLLFESGNGALAMVGEPRVVASTQTTTTFAVRIRNNFGLWYVVTPYPTGQIGRGVPDPLILAPNETKTLELTCARGDRLGLSAYGMVGGDPQTRDDFLLLGLYGAEILWRSVMYSPLPSSLSGVVLAVGSQASPDPFSRLGMCLGRGAGAITCATRAILDIGASPILQSQLTAFGMPVIADINLVRLLANTASAVYFMIRNLIEVPLFGTDFVVLRAV